MSLYVNYATGTNGDPPFGLSSDTPYQTLGYAFSQAAPNGFIDISGQYNWVDDPSTNHTAGTGFEIDKSITLRGNTDNSTKIDFGGKRGFNMTVSGQSLSIYNMDLYNAGDHSNNLICSSDESSIDLRKCWVHDCSSIGGVDSSTGGLIRDFTSVTLRECTFSTNTDYSILSIDELATCDLTNNTFYDNSNSSVIHHNGGTLKLLNNTFHNNNSSAILRLEDGTSYIKNNILSGTNPIEYIDNSGSVNQSHNVLTTDASTGSFFTNGLNNTYNGVLPDTSFGSFGVDARSIYGFPTLPIVESNAAVAGGDLSGYFGSSMPTIDARGVGRRTVDPSLYDIGSYAYNMGIAPVIAAEEEEYILNYDEEIEPISINVTDMSATAWSMSSLPSGLTYDSSTGIITGTPTEFELEGIDVDITADNSYGTSTQITIAFLVLDQYISALDQLGVPIENIGALQETAINTSSVLDLSGYSISTSTQRRSIIDMLHTRPQNLSVPYFNTLRSDLNLTTNYTRDYLRVYQKGQTVNLNDLSGDEGAYCTINAAGETCTFENVGGNGNVVVFTANGDSTYSLTYNDIDIGSGTEGEELIIGGVAFYLGSVGTEGTAGATICFTGDALVKTPNGPVPIKEITRGQEIMCGRDVAIVDQAVRVVNASPTLITIEKDALGTNYPNRKTTTTPEHKILCRDGIWHQAGDLLAIDGVESIQSNPNTYVYHLSVKDKQYMSVNGLSVETLDRNNINLQSRNHVINITKGTAQRIQ